MIEPDGKEHECERCGECCIHGSPILYISDMRLFENGTLKPGDVYTLRKGEFEYDIVNEEMEQLPEETIRIKEIPGSKFCMFYDTKSSECTIYENRPKQCVHYECWYPKKLFSIMSEDRLSRQVLFQRIPALLEVIGEHEKVCSYERIQQFVENIQSGSEEAAEELIETLRFDTELRCLIAEKMNVAEDDLAVILGRPLMQTMKMFGYKVERDEDGVYCLVLQKE